MNTMKATRIFVQAALLVSLAGLPVWAQDPRLDTFSFCRTSAGGPYEEQCIDVDASGSGTYRFTPAGDEPVEEPFEFSDYGRARFEALLRDTDYLAEGDRYESNRRVANLGLKTLVAEGTWGRREAVFNYSEMDEATGLATFFERVIGQEMLRFELEIALGFDRLGIPNLLERVAGELRGNRIADPGRLIPMMERIQSQSGVVNYAREMAADLKDDLLDRMD